MLCEPASSITDLVLGLAAVGLAAWVPRSAAISRHWRPLFGWTGAAALAGAAHHGAVTCSDRWAGPSWAVVSVMVVIAISYLLAATVDEVLGPGRGRVFWVLRSAGLVAYAALAVSGRAGVGSILLADGLTMVAVLALWAHAARLRLPLAWPVIAALLASGAAAGVRAAPADITGVTGLDPISIYHLAQIPGLVLLAMAVERAARARAAAPGPAPA